jgi:hypothetical protein
MIRPNGLFLCAQHRNAHEEHECEQAMEQLLAMDNPGGLGFLPMFKESAAG